MIYQFAFHDRVPDDPPEHFMFDLYRRLKAGAKLDRKDKDILADSLYGTFGSGRATYKVMGWAVCFQDVLQRYLVQYPWDNGKWIEFWAPDKTSLRKAIKHQGKIKVITFPTK